MFWVWMKKVLLLVGIVLAVFAVAFSWSFSNKLSIQSIKPIEAEYIGEGIYNIEIDLSSENGSEILKKSLVKFRKDHSELRIISTLPAHQNGYGAIQEILLITELK